MKQKIEKFSTPVLHTCRAILGNFTQMYNEVTRTKKTGMEHPGDNKRLGEQVMHSDQVLPEAVKEAEFRLTYERVNFLCKNRERLSTGLLELQDISHHKVISPVNDGHDRKGTPLHPDAMRAILDQAIENDSHGIPPHIPSAFSGKHEARNAAAFFSAYKDKDHHSHRYENLAGAIIHSSKGIVEQAMMDFPGDECRIGIDDYVRR